MNRLYIVIINFLVLCFVACEEADREMFSEKVAGIYFKLDNLEDDSSLILRTDTVMYTFAYDSEDVKQREICIPVELVGDAAEGERTYHIEIEVAETTEEGVDFETLASEQIFPANKTIDSLHFVWKRSPSMQKEAKQVNIRIVNGGDFMAGVEEFLFVSLQASDILEKPDWWDGWEDGFGAWHPTKLKEWIKIWGTEGLDPNPWMLSFSTYPQECTAIVKLKDIFDKEIFLDENGVRLLIPANFN